jgi:hypothetical protein
METEEIRKIILKELPLVMERDPAVQQLILDLSRKHFAGKVETENRIDVLLRELKEGREASEERWRALAEERKAEREANEERWRALAEERKAEREADEKRWTALEKERKEEREANEKRWAALAKEREEEREASERRWSENQKQINRLIDLIQEMNNRYESTIGALGARWGLRSEASFRNALKGLLEDRFHVEVLHVNEFDDGGEVFGRPEQVELDVIVRDGELLIGEIKSSMSKGDMYIFERKARFYEKRHQRKASRLFVVSPMIAPNAKPVAKNLGIETYSYFGDMDPDTV